MTTFEFSTLAIALLAVTVSFVSLYRTRKNSEIQLELEKINARLAEKQLERILESEDREGQPIFAIRVIGVRGTGDPDTSDFTVIVTVKVDNTGENYLEGKHILLVTLERGKFLGCPGAYFEHLDPREHDSILGEREIVIRPDTKIAECKLHIMYVDNLGNDRIQEYSVFPEGPKGALPHTIRFQYEKIYKIVPSARWTN